MWSSEMNTEKRRLSRIALFFALGLGLAGCFRPLYADSTTAVTGGSVKESLAAIEVAPIPDRLGHYLRNELVFDLDGSGATTQKRFRLSISTTESNSAVLTDYSTGRADSSTLTATANFTLTSLGDDGKTNGKVLTTGTATARAVYDRSAQRFANVRAARDAEIRAAKLLSESIRNRLAAQFAGGF